MLNKITIDNFKSLKHLEYDCAGLNLLTGMNGAGKSSFIQMLRTMGMISGRISDPQITFSVKDLGSDCVPSDFFYCYAKCPEIHFTVEFSACKDRCKVFTINRIMTNDDVNHRGSIAIEHPNFEAEYLGCFHEYHRMLHEQTSADYFGRNTDITQVALDAVAEQAAEDFAEAEKKMRCSDSEGASVFREMLRSFRYIDAFRMKPSDIHSGGRYSTVAGWFGGLDYEPFNAEGQDVAEYLYRSETVGEQNLNPLLDKVNACLKWVSPGAELTIKEQDVGGREYFIESVSYGSDHKSHEFKPQNVGFGVSYTLPVLVTLLSAIPDSILVIENPEAHLHPRGQAEMGKLIAETVARGVQVFVETHSDHVINGIRVAVKKGIVKPEDVNIAFFERGPHDVTQADGTTRREIYSEVTNIKVDANGSLSEWPKDFMDEWGIQQMKLLRP